MDKWELEKLRMRLRESLEKQDGYDARFGTDTQSMIAVEDLEFSGKGAKYSNLYWPTLKRTVPRVLDLLPIDHSRFTFIDIGSGKGRVLFMAADYPFARIIGVELSPVLHDIAQQNLEALKAAGQDDGRVELYCEDASRFAFPLENLVLYLFDPFQAPAVAAMVANLRVSLSRVPREVWIVYLCARHARVIDRSGLFKLVTETQRTGPHHFVPIEYDCKIYRHPLVD